MMESIYFFATRVFMWLGEPGEQFDVLIRDRKALDTSYSELLAVSKIISAHERSTITPDYAEPRWQVYANWYV